MGPCLDPGEAFPVFAVSDSGHLPEFGPQLSGIRPDARSSAVKELVASGEPGDAAFPAAAVAAGKAGGRRGHAAIGAQP